MISSNEIIRQLQDLRDEIENEQDDRYHQKVMIRNDTYNKLNNDNNKKRKLNNDNNNKKRNCNMCRCVSNLSFDMILKNDISLLKNIKDIFTKKY